VPPATSLDEADGPVGFVTLSGSARRVGVALAAAGLALALAATLTPVHDLRGEAQLTPLTCLICGDQGGADVVSNLLLFLPFAIGLRLSGRSWVRTVLACALVSLTIELLQLTVIPGRDASLSDVLSNTASGAIGAMIGRRLPEAAWPTPKLAARLLAGGIAGLLTLLAVSAWMLAPRTPAGPLFSRWAHLAPGRDEFDGRVQAVTLDGVPMPASGVPLDTAERRRRLDRGEMSLEARVVSGRPLPDRRWIYTLRVPGAGVLTLSQTRREAGIALPARAVRYRFRPAIITLPDAFPAEVGVPVRLTASEERGRLRLTSSYGEIGRSVELGLSPAYGWSLLPAFEIASGTNVRWVTALGLLLAFLPLGYWAGRIGAPATSLGALAAALVLGLGALPAAAGFPPVHWSEWVAGLLGSSAGWALHRPEAYLSRRCASPSASESSSS
jgi:hypothetical protein